MMSIERTYYVKNQINKKQQSKQHRTTHFKMPKTSKNQDNKLYNKHIKYSMLWKHEDSLVKMVAANWS